MGGKCIVCDSDEVTEFVTIRDVPVCCNITWPTSKKALDAPKGNIQLGFCRDCGHVFNLQFDDAALNYDGEYENSLHFSPRFRQYAVRLAKRLIDTYDLHNKKLIEIGCGKGDFLKLLCEGGNNRAAGFDPGYNQQSENNAECGRITFIRDFYSPAYRNYKADFICCRQVLEHIQFPRRFLLDIFKVALAGRNCAVVFFEVPNSEFTFRDLGVWDLIYEHNSFFCIKSLRHLFNYCGFNIKRCTEAYNGQFLNIDAVPTTSPVNNLNKNDLCLKRMSENVSAFTKKYDAVIKKWQLKLNRFFDAGKRIVIWSAGSKGVSFLNTIKVDEEIKYAVDINPFKQNRYIAGSGQRIVSPEFLKDYQPDIVIVMNPVYKNEIQRKLRSMQVKARLLDALNV